MKTLKRILAVMMTVLMLVSTVSVGMTSTAAKKKVKKIKLNKTSITIYVGETYKLKATVTPKNASNKKVSWSSSNKKVATVSSSGKVTAKKAGTATITVKAKDGSGKKATCKVTVKKATKVSKIKLNKTSVKLSVGKTVTIKATISPSKATNKKVKWSSSDKKVATVSSKGKITAKGVGTAKITVKAQDGSGKKATVKVTVSAVKAKSVKLNKTSATMVTNTTLKLSATFDPSNTTNKSVTWKSSDNSIATVSSSGVVTALKKGTVTITATAKDGSKKSATCKITIDKIGAAAISLNRTSYSGSPGASFTLTPTFNPSNTTNKKLKWTSSNASVATVDANGNVKLLKDGTAVITASTTDGTNRSASCTVNVKTIFVTSVGLSSSKLNLLSGSSQKLTATVYPSNATNKNVTWSSSNVSVATVDTNGNIKAINAGTAIITVTTRDGSKKASCTVTVSPKVAEVVVYPSSLSWYKGKTAKMTAVVKPAEAKQDVDWSVSDTSYATVDANGNISILKAPGIFDMDEGLLGGRAKKITVTATAKDGSGIKGTYELTIKEKVDVTGIEFAKDEDGKDLNEKVFYVNEVFDPIISYSPEGASEKTSTYTSSDPTVAKVQENGSILMVGIGKATITATSVDGGKKATWDIDVKEAKLTFNATEKKIAVGQETVTVLVSADPKSLVSKYGLKFRIEDENVLKFVKLESYGSSYYRATFAVMGSGATEVTATVGDIVETKEPVKIKVIDLKVDDYYDDLRVGSKVTIDPKAVIGNTEIQTFYVDNIPAENTPDVYGSIKYMVSSEDPDIVQYFGSDWSNGIKEDGTLELEIKKELPDEGIYIDIEFEYVHGTVEVRIEKRIHFVGKKIAMPKVDFGYVKYLANTVASNSSYNRMQKVVNYFDTKVASSALDIEASNPIINLLIYAMKDMLMAETGISADDLVHELFTESTVEPKENADGMKAITCDEAAVESITLKDDGGCTYEVVLELKDQQKMALNAIADSAYGKTMPVIDKTYADKYVEEMAKEMGTNEKNSIKYGTLNQTYRDGKVVFTINKLTDQIEKVEYYFKADLDFKNAQMVMSEPIDAMGTVDITVNATFTTTVEEKITYYFPNN